MSRIDEWNEDSLLSRNGYSADGSISEIRRHMILDKIIAKYDTKTHLEIISHFRWLIDNRGVRMPKAKMIWVSDLQYFCIKMNTCSSIML